MKSTISPNARSPRRRAHAFTLIELLVVITVIAILIAVAAPTILGSVGASRLTSGGETLVGLFSEAQARSNSSNRPVEVRLYRVPSEEDQMNDVGAEGFYRGVLFLEYYQPGETDPRTAKLGTLVQLQKPLAIVRNSMHLLPGGTVMSENDKLSTLIANRPKSQDSTGQAVETILRSGTGYQNYTPPATEYRAFIFYPEGTDLDESAKWHVTVTSQDDCQKAPDEVKNFYTLQVDPLTARLTSYRPTMQR
ncbi:MAG: Verru_Chthon cassette protein D [Roseimicrobium sp.]